VGETLIDHFESPRNVGDVPSPDAVGTAENPVCGDEVRVSARVREGLVREIRYRAFGCHATIAAMSLLSERVRGGTVEEATSVGPEMLMGWFESFPRGKEHAAEVAVAAVRRALAGADR
jgi:nitrogen fixation NifU-like protein